MWSIRTRTASCWRYSWGIHGISFLALTYRLQGGRGIIRLDSLEFSFFHHYICKFSVGFTCLFVISSWLPSAWYRFKGACADRRLGSIRPLRHPAGRRKRKPAPDRSVKSRDSEPTEQENMQGRICPLLIARPHWTARLILRMVHVPQTDSCLRPSALGTRAVSAPQIIAPGGLRRNGQEPLQDCLFCPIFIFPRLTSKL